MGKWNEAGRRTSPPHLAGVPRLRRSLDSSIGSIPLGRLLPLLRGVAPHTRFSDVEACSGGLQSRVRHSLGAERGFPLILQGRRIGPAGYSVRIMSKAFFDAKGPLVALTLHIIMII